MLPPLPSPARLVCWPMALLLYVGLPMLNGTPKGLIEGADFAAALFSIWLGPNPIDSKFKQALLGE